MATSTKPRPQKPFNARQWGIGGDQGKDLIPPPDPNSGQLRCIVSGAKPRYVSADQSFAIWSAVWDKSDLKDELTRAVTAMRRSGSDPRRIAELEKELKSSSERPVTIKGALARVSSGEMLICKGRWRKHAKYGWSFEVSDYTSALPVDDQGVAMWLQTRVDGVGPTFAKAIVKHFGAENVYEVLDADPTKLREVKTEKGRALAKKQVEAAIAAWDEAKAIRQIETFLFSHGVSAKRADQLYRHYGEEVIDILTNTPYRISELRGIGFKIADGIARSMGVKVDDPSRVEAAIMYCLEKAEEQGHVFLSLDQMKAGAGMALKFEETGETAGPKAIVDGASRLAAKAKIKVEDDEHLEQRIYAKHWWDTECRVARMVREMLNPTGHMLFPKQERPMPPEGATPEEVEALKLPSDEQWGLIDLVRANRISILSGGPGVGKSQSITWLMQITERTDHNVHLCAPTGKAARRMAELTGHEAKTIHRLLEYSPFEGGFQRDEENPLKGDLLIVDECSMLQLDLADCLLRAIPQNMHVLLVGDPDQLPPVGAGKVFDDLINSEAVPRVHLNKIFRQAAKSMIIQNARRLNTGQLPYLKKEEAEAELGNEMLNDFFWVPRKTPESTLAMTVDMTVNRIPRTFGFDPRTEIMVLAPQRGGKVGLHVLNSELELKLNAAPDGSHKKPIVNHAPQKVNDQLHQTGLCVGSRIVQTKNMYHPDGPEKSVMNGEVGMIVDHNETSSEALLRFEDGREFWLPTSDMDSFQLAWALTIHRSQGSQWPCVVAPVSTSHYAMLSRNLEYVAVTRAEKLCLMVGEVRALQMAVGKKEMQKRNSTLVARINEPALSGELF